MQFLDITAHPGGGGTVVRKMSPNEVNDEVFFVVLHVFLVFGRGLLVVFLFCFFLDLIHCKPYY